MRIVTSMFIAGALLCTTAAAQLKSPRTAASQQMFDELAGKDSELFDAVFNSCNPDKLKELVTEDFEFYHDKWGQTAKSGAEFANAIRNLCERQKKS